MREVGERERERERERELGRKRGGKQQREHGGGTSKYVSQTISNPHTHPSVWLRRE